MFLLAGILAPEHIIRIFNRDTAVVQNEVVYVLWDKNKKIDDIAKEYLQFAFGEDWEFVQKYLATLSEVSEYSEHRYYSDVQKNI